MVDSMNLQTWTVIIQIVAIVLDIAYVFIMVKQIESRLSKYMICIAFLSFMQNGGYLLELLSNDVSQAMMSIRVEYMGSAFISTFVMLFIIGYCDVEYNTKICYFFVGLDLLILIAVWTSDLHPYFYKSVTFVKDVAIPHVNLGKGILYYVYAFFVAVKSIYSLVCIVRRYSGTEDEAKKNTLVLAAVCSVVPISAFLLNLFNLADGYDVVPAAVSFSMFVLGMTIVYQHEFDMASMAHEKIIKEMDEAILIVDLKCNIIEVNESAKKIFGDEQRYVTGEKIIDTEFVNLINTCVDNAVVTTEYEKNNLVYEVHITEIRRTKNISGYTILLFDVTSQKRQLEKMQQLKVAADEANHAKTDFLARMSHEIRSPINAVVGMTEMILRESTQEDIRAYALDSKNSTETLLSIVNDLLDSAKIEAGKMEINPVEYRIDKLLKDLKNMMSVKAKEKRLALRMVVDENIPSVLLGDDVRVKQILLNILSNAIKYTSKGGILVTVTGDIEEDDVILHCSVKDTGIGIKSENLPHLFDAFERINVGKNRYIEGTGLGLNITSKFLNLMGSELKVESTYGEGSCFYFDLKQGIIDSEPIGDFQKKIQKNETEFKYKVGFTAPDAKVLVVDDNKVNLKVFTSLLKNTQIQITTAISGRECIEYVKNNKYDLIFLDHMMPEMDGVKTLHHMKKMAVNRSLEAPVIMLTANASEGAKEQYIQEGFDEFLSKPIDTEALEMMIYKMLPKNLINKSDFEEKE